MEISFKWTSEDLKNFDLTTLTIVTSKYWRDCITLNKWIPECGDHGVKPGDVLALIAGLKYVFGVVCSREEGYYQVAWVNEIEMPKSIPRINERQPLNELPEWLARETMKTANRFLR